LENSLIRMFTEVGAAHRVAHFHPYYQDAVAVISIDPLQMIADALPGRQLRLVEAWAELHQDELQADWDLLQTGQKPAAISPLI
jgi:hypothetical protein